MRHGWMFSSADSGHRLAVGLDGLSAHQQQRGSALDGGSHEEACPAMRHAPLSPNACDVALIVSVVSRGGRWLCELVNGV